MNGEVVEIPRKRGRPSNASRLLATAEATVKPVSRVAVISEPKIREVTVHLRGTAPYCQHRFGEKAMKKMMATQLLGQQARAKRTREARNFDEDYEAAKHLSTEGWCGIPAGAFRTAMIDVCRLVGFKMTQAKLSVFVLPDGFDKVDSTPLVRINGKVEKHIAAARNDNGGADIRVRPLWRQWSCDLRVAYDEDQFSVSDVMNLLQRAGIQCGIGEGRPNSRDSTGCGWGTFKIEG